jgi:predicted PurR-regulated permease PerM
MQTEKKVISITTGTMIRALLVISGAVFLYYVRDLVGMLLVSLLLAAAMNPIADYFDKKRVPRSLTVLAIYVIIFLFAGVLLVAIIPPMIEEMRSLIQNFGSIWQRLLTNFHNLRDFTANYGLENGFQQSVDAMSARISESFTDLFATATSVLNGIISFFVVLVITFFLVVEKNGLKDMVVSFVPERYHGYVADMAGKVQRKVGQWVLGQIILMAFVGVISYIGLLAFGVKYALLLAIIAGVTEIIPYAGPVAAAIPAILFAAADSPTKGILVFLLYFLIQRIENMILVPKVMQKTTGLNPILAILSLAVGFSVGGLAGGLLAIPVATAGQVILADLMDKQNRNV